MHLFSDTERFWNEVVVTAQAFLTNLQNLCIKLAEGSVGKRYLVCSLIFKRQKWVLGSQLSVSQTNTTLFYKHHPNPWTLLCCFTANYCGWKGESSFASQRGRRTLSWEKGGHRAGLSGLAPSLGQLAGKCWADLLWISAWKETFPCEWSEGSSFNGSCTGSVCRLHSLLCTGWFGLKCAFCTVHRLLQSQLFHIWWFLPL